MAWSEEQIRAHLKKGNLTGAQIDEYIEAEKKADACINELKCPKCGGKLSRKLDARQAGPTDCAGSWFNYKCSCGYLVDRVEEPN